MDIVKILQDNGIRPTAGRMLVLRAVAESDVPVSLMELEMSLGSVDKSQVSRALAVFMEKDILHRIEGPDGVAKYELCHCVSNNHDALHVHFYCKECGKLTCLKDLAIPQMELPDGYEYHDASFVINGICPECRH